VPLLVSHAMFPLQESRLTVTSFWSQVSPPLQEPRAIDAVFSSQVGPDPLQESFAIDPEFWKQTSNRHRSPVRPSQCCQNTRLTLDSAAVWRKLAARKL
jgi:hypothetical protein